MNSFRACSSPARSNGLFVVESQLSDDGRTRQYQVSGQVFLAVIGKLSSKRFDSKEVLDPGGDRCQRCAILGYLGGGLRLTRRSLKFRREGTVGLEIVGLNETSAALIERYARMTSPAPKRSWAGH